MRALFVVFVMGCAGHLHGELVGQGATSGPAPASIALPAGSYEVALGFELPRAQLVEYTVTCPGVLRHGTLGETFEAYRARRIAELRSQTVHAAVGPVEATIVPQLAPDDVGAGRVMANVHVVTTAPGACTIAATADDAIAGEYRVTRIRDLDAEARLRIMAANIEVVHARAALENQLVGYGAVIHYGRCEGGDRVDPEREAAWHELEVVVRTRKALRAQLVAMGAVERPPMPEPVPEERPAPPAPSSAWTAGRWTWRGRWVWVAGGWNARGVVIRPATARDHRR
jgi:hypothetical protein